MGRLGQMGQLCPLGLSETRGKYNIIRAPENVFSLLAQEDLVRIFHLCCPLSLCQAQALPVLWNPGELKIDTNTSKRMGTLWLFCATIKLSRHLCYKHQTWCSVTPGVLAATCGCLAVVGECLHCVWGPLHHKYAHHPTWVKSTSCQLASTSSSCNKGVDAIGSKWLPKTERDSNPSPKLFSQDLTNTPHPTIYT